MASGGGCGTHPTLSRAAHGHPAPGAQHTQTPLPHGVSAAHRRGVPGVGQRSGTPTPRLPGVSWGALETHPGAPGWLRTGSGPAETPCHPCPCSELEGRGFGGFWGYLSVPFPIFAPARFPFSPLHPVLQPTRGAEDGRGRRRLRRLRATPGSVVRGKGCAKPLGW